MNENINFLQKQIGFLRDQDLLTVKEIKEPAVLCRILSIHNHIQNIYEYLIRQEEKEAKTQFT